MATQTFIHDEPNWQDVQSVWMFISVDDEGREGLVAVPFGNMTIPLVTGNEALLVMMKEVAAKAARLFPHKRVKLVRFTQREDLEFIDPK